MTPGEIHNRDVGPIIRAIVMPTMEAGGESTEILVLLESVIAGVLLFLVRSGGDEPVVDKLAENVKVRMAELRTMPEVRLN